MAGTKARQNPRVHVAGGVDAEAVDPEVVDPPAVDLDEARHDTRVLGEDVVQRGEVTQQRALAGERALAPVMVVDRIVQPGRRLGVLLARGNVGRVGPVRARQLAEILAVEGVR